jgi:hypothetical protein
MRSCWSLTKSCGAPRAAGSQRATAAPRPPSYARPGGPERLTELLVTTMAWSIPLSTARRPPRRLRAEAEAQRLVPAPAGGRGAALAVLTGPKHAVELHQRLPGPVRPPRAGGPPFRQAAPVSRWWGSPFDQLTRCSVRADPQRHRRLVTLDRTIRQLSSCLPPTSIRPPATERAGLRPVDFRSRGNRAGAGPAGAEDVRQRQPITDALIRPHGYVDRKRRYQFNNCLRRLVRVGGPAAGQPVSEVVGEKPTAADLLARALTAMVSMKPAYIPR